MYEYYLLNNQNFIVTFGVNINLTIIVAVTGSFQSFLLKKKLWLNLIWSILTFFVL